MHVYMFRTCFADLIYLLMISPVVEFTVVEGAIKIMAASRNISLWMIVPIPPRPLTTESIPQDDSLQ